jgi:hypothetical protein
MGARASTQAQGGGLFGGTSNVAQGGPTSNVTQGGGPFGGPSNVTRARITSVTPLAQSPTVVVPIKNSTSGPLYISTDSKKNKTSLASGKTGMLSGLCSNCSIFVYTDSGYSQTLAIIPYKTFMTEAQGKSQPVLDIGISSKVIDSTTFIATSSTPTMMNMNSYPTPMMNSYPTPTMMNTTTPTAYTPRPTINATLINPTTMKK